jgi:two-component system sensor histidine kinase QseC
MRSVKTIRLNSLGLKVLLAFVAGILLSIVLVVAAAFVAFQNNVLAEKDLAHLTEDMAEKIRFDGSGRPVGFDMGHEHMDDEALSWVFESMSEEVAYRILDDAGKAVLLSSAGTTFWPSGGDAVRLARGTFEFEREGVTLHGATEKVVHEGQTWYLQFAASTRFMHLLHRVAAPLVGIGILVFSLVLFVVFGVTAYITLGCTLRPLRRLSESAAGISPRSLHARLKTDSIPCEIEPVVESFNRVLERLEQGYRVQQEFLGHAAHELKTPLGLIRAQVELSKAGEPIDHDALLKDVEYMTRQVQQLLLLAEASEVNNYAFAVVRVQDVATEAVSYLQRMADAAGVRVTVSAFAGEVKWKADRGALFTLLKNLLENAIPHAPSGSIVSIEIDDQHLTVRDRGQGVDAEQLPLLFARFWRGAHRRDHGAGLGLPICQEIAMAHGWALTVECAEPGLRFRLSNAEGGQPAFS